VAGELRVGTRGSQLALWQANAVVDRIRSGGGPPCRIVVIKTSGDRLQEAPLAAVGGKRLFVKELEDALARDEIDLAVHSSKDMPASLPGDLTIGAVLPREDPLDALVLPQSARMGGSMSFAEAAAALGPAPTLGTSSVRRAAQLARVFPRAMFKPIRGNLDTRLRKLDEGGFSAIVLASAGLLRLGMAARVSARLPPDVCVPAPGQGIVAVELRAGDAETAAAVRPIDDREARAALDAERAVVERLGGGCQTPIGVLATPQPPEQLAILAVVVSLDGRRAIRGEGKGLRDDACAIGTRVGDQLLAEGAGDILEEARKALGSVEGIQP
jgi:hydroxymethylbilane synthase